MKAAVAFAILGLVACGPSGRHGGGGDDGGDDDTTVDAPPGEKRQCNKMDIVFVVDDSGSMQEEQTNLATNFPMFANLLATYTTSEGDPIDFRIGLTTTGRDVSYSIVVGGQTITMNEMGANGAFRNNCNINKRWLEPSDPNMQQALACRAKVGTSGPSIEMPMLMTRFALSERVADGTNANFLRNDALLAVVMITDEDDASTTQNNFQMSLSGATPVDFNPPDMVSFLDNVKGNRSRWASAVIAGDGNCSSAFGEASNAARLKQFVQLANGNGTTQAVFSSICAGDLTTPLKAALDLFQQACGNIVL
ncbi:MAG: hypothetical protein KF773_07280 [Deltaproteobacteria bacterium]|nr:hypothetical protein [Deltaproteobacteria bacterium]